MITIKGTEFQIYQNWDLFDKQLWEMLYIYQYYKKRSFVGPESGGV